MSEQSIAYPKDISTLTSLRFFAAMLVVAHHFAYFLPFDVTEYSWFLKRGALAVDFFFILSGFILAHVYGDAVCHSQITFRQFITRRFARVYPLHLLTLGVAAILMLMGFEFRLSGQGDGQFPGWSLIIHLLLIQGWGFERELLFNVPSWSISAEWFAYLVFPSLIMFLVKKKPAIALCSTAFFMLGLWLFFDAYMPRVTTRLTNDCSVFRIIPEFILGITLYYYFRQRKPNPFAGLLLLQSVILLVPLLHFGLADILIVFLLAAIIIFAADLNRLGYSGWLTHKFWIFCGEASYAIYMTHYIVMVFILRGATMWFGGDFYLNHYGALFGLTILMTLIASAFLFRFFEMPMRGKLTHFLCSLEFKSGKIKKG